MHLCTDLTRSQLASISPFHRPHAQPWTTPEQRPKLTNLNFLVCQGMNGKLNSLRSIYKTHFSLWVLILIFSFFPFSFLTQSCTSAPPLLIIIIIIITTKTKNHWPPSNTISSNWNQRGLGIQMKLPNHRYEKKSPYWQGQVDRPRVPVFNT